MTKAEVQSEVNGTIASDLPRGVALLADLTTNLKTAQATFDTLTQKIKDGDLSTAQGISLLELKNQTFLSYLANLTYVTLCKLKGCKIEGSASVGRLVEQRAVLERLRPLQEKLKYQLDKHVKAATEGVACADDPSRLKGDLDNIATSSSDEEEEEVGGEGKKKKKKGEEEDDDGKAYKVPKITQTKYDLEEDKEEAKERARRRVLNSSMLRDALEDHTEDPEVVHNTDVLKLRAIKKRKEIEMYEETHMIRKQLSKKERAAQRQITTLGTMGSEMLGFTSLDPLHDSAVPDNEPPAKKPKTSSAKSKSGKGKGKGKFGKGKKKGFKKRRKH